MSSFSPGGNGMSRAFERPEGTELLKPQSYADMAWENRQRIEQPAQPYEMFLAPNEGCVLCLRGVEYTSQKDAQFGFVWPALPVMAVNEFVQLQKIHFEEGKGYIQLTLKMVRYP